MRAHRRARPPRASAWRARPRCRQRAAPTQAPRRPRLAPAPPFPAGPSTDPERARRRRAATRAPQRHTPRSTPPPPRPRRQRPAAPPRRSPRRRSCARRSPSCTARRRTRRHSPGRERRRGGRRRGNGRSWRRLHGRRRALLRPLPQRHLCLLKRRLHRVELCLELPDGRLGSLDHLLALARLLLGGLQLGVGRPDAGDRVARDLVPVAHRRLRRARGARRLEGGGREAEHALLDLQHALRRGRRRLAWPADEERVGQRPRVEACERHAVHRQLDGRRAELHVGRHVLGGVDRHDAHVLSLGQNLLDELGERRARAKLDEDARAVAVHGLHLLHPLHRRDHLLAQQRRRVCAAARVRRVARDVRVDLCARGRLKLARGALDGGAKSRAGRGEERRVEGARDRERHHAESGGLHPRRLSGDGGRLAGDDDLPRLVDVCEPHVGRAQGERGGVRADDRRHRLPLAGRGRHCVGARTHEPERRGAIEDAGGAQGRELAERVSRDEVGAQPGRGEDVERTERDGDRRRLRVRRLLQPRLVAEVGVRRVRLAREEHLGRERHVHRPRLERVLVHLRDGRPHRRPVHRDVLEHAGVLPALPREDRRNLARRLRARRSEVRALPRQSPRGRLLLGGQLVADRCQHLHRVRCALRDEAHPRVRRRRPALRRRVVSHKLRVHEGERALLGRVRAATVRGGAVLGPARDRGLVRVRLAQRGGEGVERGGYLCGERSRRRRAHQHEVGAAVRTIRPRVVGLELLDDAVVVCAAEAEGGDARAAGHPGTREPGSRARVDVEGRVGDERAVAQLRRL
mmetsp:Transcript_36263/g.119474  ORF Transcript_36263/g.119474 Transcript_36263/m.119474 type:complete len:804 (-) Transcript_36263:1336-3747(-)